jgi:hypothetical protein
MYKDPLFTEYIENFNKANKDIQLVSVLIGLVSGNKKNPFKTIQFYDETEPTITTIMNGFALFHDCYQETLLYVYTLNETVPESLMRDIVMDLDKYRGMKNIML